MIASGQTLTAAADHRKHRYGRVACRPSWNSGSNVSVTGILANTLLLATSLLVTLAAAELWLRYGMSPERLVPNAPETPTLNERRNALRFYGKQRERAKMGGHDRWLGWDAGDDVTRVRGRRTIPPTKQGELRENL